MSDLQDMVNQKEALQRQHAELQRKIHQLDEGINEFNSLPTTARLAILLHRKLCRSSHEDECEWEYEITGGRHRWNGLAHERWVHRSIGMLARIPNGGLNADNIEKWLEEVL